MAGCPAVLRATRHMLFNVSQALKGLEQRSNSLIDLLANSTGRTVDVMYATLVHRCVSGTASPAFHQALYAS